SVSRRGRKDRRNDDASFGERRHPAVRLRGVRANDAALRRADRAERRGSEMEPSGGRPPLGDRSPGAGGGNVQHGAGFGLERVAVVAAAAADQRRAASGGARADEAGGVEDSPVV